MNAKNLKFIELTDDLSTNYNMHFIDIAEKLGIHQSNMSSYRSGRINVGVNVLNRTIALHKEITSTKQNQKIKPNPTHQTPRQHYKNSVLTLAGHFI